MIKQIQTAAIIAVVLCIGSLDASAQEQERKIQVPPGGTVYIPPNPMDARALAKTAATSLSVQREVEGFMAKLMEGKEYAQRFDAAVAAKDKRRLMTLIRDGGIRTGEVTIDEIAGKKISITIHLKNIDITIGFEW